MALRCRSNTSISNAIGTASNRDFRTAYNRAHSRFRRDWEREVRATLRWARQRCPLRCPEKSPKIFTASNITYTGYKATRRWNRRTRIWTVRFEIKLGLRLTCLPRAERLPS